MDRARRAEPYSSATIWTREIARNLAGHLSRVSKAHSCVDTRSPKSTRLPQFHHAYAQKRCPTSPIKARPSILTATQHSEGEAGLEFHGFGASSAREEADTTPRSVRKSLGANSQRVDGRRKSLPRKIKSISVQAQTDSEDGNTVLTVNQDASEQSMKIPVIKAPAKQPLRGSTYDGTTYVAPPTLSYHRHRVVHDYNKRQEQRKIWQENQALNKRLQSTKATLNSKEWEKDDKWTQEFLRNQERRRLALHQEMRKAQISPQAVIRVKPLKLQHPPHLRDTPHQTSSEKNLRSACSPLKTDIQGALTARESSCRGSKDQVRPVARGKAGTTSQHATAANHRRIMELRKKRPSPAGPESKISCPGGDSVPSSEAASAHAKGNTVVALGDPSELQSDEVVNVRFTFSRGRGTSTKSGAVGDLQRAEAMDEEHERDVMSLSGAFSPGAELELALNTVAMDDDTLTTTNAAANRTGASRKSAQGKEASQTSIEAYTSYGEDEDEDEFTAVMAALQDCVGRVIRDSERTHELDPNTKEATGIEKVPSGNSAEINDSSIPITEGPTPADTEDDKATESSGENPRCPALAVADEAPRKVEDGMVAVKCEHTQLDVEAASLVNVEQTPGSPRAADLRNSGAESRGHLEATIDEHTDVSKPVSVTEDCEELEEIGVVDVEPVAGGVVASPIEASTPVDDDAPADDIKEEEGYEEDNFDEEALVSARASEESEPAVMDAPETFDAKEEASGYGSEFEEDEDPEQDLDTVEQDTAAVGIAPESGDSKYEEEEGEASYSRDGFD